LEVELQNDSMKEKMMHFALSMSCMRFYQIKPHLDDLASNLGYTPRTLSNLGYTPGTFERSIWGLQHGG